MVTTFERIFTSIPTPFNFVVLIVLIGCVTGAITSLATQFRIFICHQSDLAFKRDLVERGWQMHDIEQLAQTKVQNPRNA